jgi:hypothetical protein
MGAGGIRRRHQRARNSLLVLAVTTTNGSAMRCRLFFCGEGLER